MTTHPINETVDRTRRSLTESECRKIAAAAIEAVNELRREAAVNAKVDRVIAATEAVIKEATEKPLHERPEAERRRIESDLWTLAEAMTQRRRRSPFWDGLQAA